MRFGPHPLVTKVITENAQRGDFAPFDAGQTAPFVNIGDENVGFRRAGNNAVGNDRLALGRTQRNRFEERVFGVATKSNDIVENVDEANFPRLRRGTLAGNEEKFLRNRERMREFRPSLRDRQVDNDRLNFLAVTGDSLDGAGRLLSALRRVEDNEVADSRRFVVPADDRDELRGVAGERPRAEHRGRPIGTASVKLRLVRPVRVHMEHNAGKRVRQVDVFPTQVHNAPVVKNDRVPVVVLLERQLADGAVFFAEVKVANVPAPVDARNAGLASGRAEDDSPVRKVTGVVIVDVRRFDGREKGGGSDRVPFRIERKFPKAPTLREFRVGVSGVRRGEHYFVGVVMEFEVADELAVFRNVNVGFFAGSDVDANERVAVAGRREDGVAVKVVGKTEFVRVSTNGEERGEIEIGVREERFFLERGKVGGQRGGAFGVGDRFRFFAQFGEAFKILGAVRVIVGERLDEVRNGAFERVEIGKNESGRDEIGRGDRTADLF